MDAGVDLLAIEVLGTSLDTFHELVLVAGSELALFAVLLSLGDLSLAFASGAGLVEQVGNILIAEGGRSIANNGGDGGGVDLGHDGIFLCWGVDYEVDRVLLDIQSDAHLTWDANAEGTDGLDGVSGSESWEMVVHGGGSVNVESVQKMEQVMIFKQINYFFVRQ